MEETDELARESAQSVGRGDNGHPPRQRSPPASMPWLRSTEGLGEQCDHARGACAARCARTWVWTAVDVELQQPVLIVVRVRAQGCWRSWANVSKIGSLSRLRMSLRRAAARRTRRRGSSANRPTATRPTGSPPPPRLSAPPRPTGSAPRAGPLPQAGTFSSGLTRSEPRAQRSLLNSYRLSPRQHSRAVLRT